MTDRPDCTSPSERPLTILGIETSCDETAAAVVRGVPGTPGSILSNTILSQLDDHRPYGGVVPEIAARSHLAHIGDIVRTALTEAETDLSSLDGIAVTGGPGLIGGVMVGVMTAKAMASAAELPFVAVNHLAGHALTPRLTDGVPFPYLLLLVSGGHCQLLIVEAHDRFTRLGTTVDDALGEAFDKTAKVLGLGYPGGPAVEQAALSGDPSRLTLPRPMVGRAGCDFSFSGLKTAVRQAVDRLGGEVTKQDQSDLSAAFQVAASASLSDRVSRAMAIFREHVGSEAKAHHFVVAGGVAANRFLIGALEALSVREGFHLTAPPPRLCTDNAAMIAWAGIERMAAGSVDGMDFAPRPRWPLDPDAQKRQGSAPIGAAVKA